MDAKKKQLKRLKREKVRKQHLERAREAKVNTGVSLFLSAGGITHGRPLPERNDRNGWMTHNELSEKAVLKKAFSMYPNEPLLKRMFVGQFNDRDTLRISLLLSRAAQSIYCDSPKEIPYWIISGHPTSPNYFSGLTSVKLKKIATPDGSAWGHPATLLENGMQVMFSSHALERMKQRLEMSNIPEQPFWCMFLACKTSPYPGMFSIVGGEWTIGYCPYSVFNSHAIASTFLLPGMKGTPEEAYVTRLLSPGETLTASWFTTEKTAFAEAQNFSLPPLRVLVPWLRTDYDEMYLFEKLYKTFRSASKTICTGS